jgi:hypothetical protein
MAVPKEDDPNVMAMVCLDCHEILEVFGPGDLEDEGHSLGDPDPWS